MLLYCPDVTSCKWRRPSLVWHAHFLFGSITFVNPETLQAPTVDRTESATLIGR